MPVALLLALVAAAVPPPTTVNGEVLGKAEDYRLDGPSVACINFTSVELKRGETAYLAYRGIHTGSIRVMGPLGEVLVQDGNMGPKPGEQAREDRNGRLVTRLRDKGAVRYILYDRSDAGPAGRVEVSGSALGRGRDAAILDRVTLYDQQPPNCTRRFDYGWDFFL